METHAPVSTAVASAVTPTTNLAAVGHSLDPRHIVTPIDVDKVEHILCKHNIYDLEGEGQYLANTSPSDPQLSVK